MREFSEVQIAKDVPKPVAAIRVAQLMGVENFEPYFGDVRSLLRQARQQLGTLANQNLRFINSKASVGSAVSVLKAGFESSLGKPSFLNGRPNSFPPFLGSWPNGTPDLRVIEVDRGSIALAPDCPIVFDQDVNVIEDFSTKYAGLLSYYDFSIDEGLDSAVKIDGTALSIIDDVYGLNYCHWISDWLTRIAPFEKLLSQSDFYVIVSPITTDWQISSLESIGVSRNRLIELSPWKAVTANKLLVLSDISNIMHPAQKGADWSMKFLFDTGIKYAAERGRSTSSSNRKLYISRSDASGRRITNEFEFLNRLESFGYEKIVLSDHSFEEQISLFSSSSHVIGIHGAGLTNVVYCHPGTSVIEILPSSYGTPAFCVLALARQLKYYTYICDDIRSGDRSQLDDMLIDVEAFVVASRTIL